tara:strand:+ start:11441 stop:11599 length:159 start_codon:yes stop_codon:yes gene_type:complete
MGWREEIAGASDDPYCFLKTEMLNELLARSRGSFIAGTRIFTWDSLCAEVAA